MMNNTHLHLPSVHIVQKLLQYTNYTLDAYIM